MSQFAENLKKLPGVSHLAAINLLDGEGNLVVAVENKAGSQGSLAVYNIWRKPTVRLRPMRRKKGWNCTRSTPKMHALIRASIPISTDCLS